MFYVYLLTDENGIPFYVGKGKGNRSRRHFHKSHSKFIRRIVEKIKRSGKSPISKIIFESMDEQEIFAKECQLIKSLGRRNNKTGVLANLTDGGEGQSGRILSVETKLKIGEKSKGRRPSAEARQKISLAHKGRKHTQEARRSFQKSAIARATPDYCAKQAERTRATWTPERRAKQSEWIKNRWQSDPAYRDRVATANSENAKRQWRDPVLRERVVTARNAVR